MSDGTIDLSDTMEISHDLIKSCWATLEERQEQYGDPSIVFDRLALLWDCSASEAAYRMAQLKLARIETSPKCNRDSYLDAVNYLVLAYALKSLATRVIV